MSQKINFEAKVSFVGKEYVEAKEASEYDGKKYPAKSEHYDVYFLLGKGVDKDFFITKPTVLVASVSRISFDKLVKGGAVFEAEVETDYDRYILVAVKGLEIVSKTK
jgi:hypothetical protein